MKGIGNWVIFILDYPVKPPMTREGGRVMTGEGMGGGNDECGMMNDECGMMNDEWGLWAVCSGLGIDSGQPGNKFEMPVSGIKFVSVL